MNRRQILTPSVIPNMFTAMNMFCGFLSIINTSQGNFTYASWLIVIAAIFDALDGAMARLTRSSSELGVELDSLSDAISFGAAPAFLMYSTFLFNFDAAGIILSSLILISAGFRLARFNVQLVGFNKSFFYGLPTPISAITIASFVLAFYNSENGFEEPYATLVIPIVLLLALLMISKIKYDTMPKFSVKGLKEKPMHFVFLLTAIILLITTTVEGLFFIFAFMILFGIFRHGYNLISKKS